MASPDLFDAYFRRADTDRDGRISGQEAVSFFQGANLNREVLAKIWQYADQGQTGYLSRAEFYNALKLVTVAQTGRDLTPAIVSRALNGPAASQIPAPQIQYASGPAPAAPQAQPPGGAIPVRPMGPSAPQYQQYTAANMPPGPRPMAPTSQPRPTNIATPTRSASMSTDWPTTKSSSWSGPASSSNQNGQVSQVQIPSTPQDGLQGSFFAGANSTAPKAEPDFFGGDVFTAVPAKPAVVSSQALASLSATQMHQPSPTANQVPQPRATQGAVQPGRALVPSSFTPAATSNMLQSVATPAGQQDRGMGTPSFGIDASKTWPKMTDAIVRRYTKIFFEVDTDKDGKISGTQARDLFLSWHLPREVLKQIWDLSDQDHDSMLSLREFCVALYLMERHREGRTLPAAIPAAFYFDETGVQALRISEAQVAVAQNSAGYNLPAWRQNPGVLQGTGPGLPPRAVSGLPGQSQVRAPTAVHGRDVFASPQMVHPSSRAPVMDMKSVNQLAADDQLTLQSKHQGAVDSERKVQEYEKRIMDSKEKMEFYRTKMQDIVLFKTRCDNRLAEITEKAAADKREVEAMAKRYDEKYKQAGESQARLLADEAAFRDVQERRLELYSALQRMEQGGDLNAFLQVRADRLQTDLGELKKVLNTKCKQFGLRIKPVSLLEIPFGWQPGIQDTAAQWDDNWDTFEDEGFAYVQDLMEEGTAGSDASKPKSVASWDESGHDPLTTDAEVHAEETVSEGNEDTTSSKDHQDSTAENGDHEDVSSSSPGHSGSGISSTKDTSDSQKLDRQPSSSQVEFDDFSSNGGDWASVFSHKNDDTDSNASWGRSDALGTKASEDSGFQAGRLNTAKSFELSNSFDMLSVSGKGDLPTFGPIRTKERTPVFFDNSVPSTPLHSSFSPGPISSGGFFDDSVPSTPLYNNHATGSGSNRDHFTRFDSFSSTTSDFRPSSDSFARFDSFNHAGSGFSQSFTSFDEHDMLGTGPLGGGQSSRRSTDAWSSFG
eukprot:c22237_g1_i1 orf=56-3061(+)